MDNRNNHPSNDENKRRAKQFWKQVGFIGIALALALITVFVLYLNL